MSDGGLSGARWFKSSHSGTSGECVEVVWLDDGQVGVRDSKCADGPALVFGARAWSTFVTSVWNGEVGRPPS
ncbi:DUF397 domain-containing protein [Nocardia sp. NPDC050799]|uniref:DUF397 domain-containing protein n=1 Tax=Nocardia sp. NPDC050799 TaxID=3154842 RepID=UPI0033E44DA3